MPRKIRKKIVDKIVKLAQEGYTNVEIKENTGISLPTIRKILREAKARGRQQATIAEQQKELEELRQRLNKLDDLGQKVNDLENAASTTLALSKHPTQCQNEHPYYLVLRCIDPGCSENGEFWVPLDGSKPIGPSRFALMHVMQNQYRKTGRIPDSGILKKKVEELTNGSLASTAPEASLSKSPFESRQTIIVGPPSDEEMDQWNEEQEAKRREDSATPAEETSTETKQLESEDIEPESASTPPELKRNQKKTAVEGFIIGDEPSE